MTTDTDSKILKKLSEPEKEDGNPPLLLDFYHKILQTQSKVQTRISTPESGISSEALRTRLQKGIPLIGFNDLALDWSLARDTYIKIAAVFAGYPELFDEIPEKLKKPGAGRLLTRKAVKAWFTGKKLPATTLDGASENLMQAIMQATMKPFLAAYSKVMIGFVEQERWRRSYCPVCGGNPDFAFLEKELGARWLLCSRCDAEWLFQRIECPFCNNKDQNTISYFTDDGLYRLYVCEQCKQYLKTIDLRKAREDVIMPLERLFTYSIDAQAWQYGYGYSDKP